MLCGSNDQSFVEDSVAPGITPAPVWQPLCRQNSFVKVTFLNGMSYVPESCICTSCSIWGSVASWQPRHWLFTAALCLYASVVVSFTKLL